MKKQIMSIVLVELVEPKGKGLYSQIKNHYWYGRPDEH